MNKGLKTALVIGGIAAGVIVILSIVPGIIWGWRGYGGMMGPGMMGGYSSMFLMPIIWIVVIGLIVWAVTAAFRRPGHSDTLPRTGDSALEILERRYARGEINKQEFEDKRRDLL